MLETQPFLKLIVQQPTVCKTVVFLVPFLMHFVVTFYVIIPCQSIGFPLCFFFNFHFQFASTCKHLILETCNWGMEFQSLLNVTGIIYRTRTPQMYLESYRYMLSTATAFLRGHFGVLVLRTSIDYTYKMLCIIK